MNIQRISIGSIGGVFVALAFAFGTAGQPAISADFFLKDGDRIVMMGDSITEQHMYSTYVELWTVTRFPTWSLTFRNVGIGGDGAPGGNNRFKRDVLPCAATAMTVAFGMNDAGGNIDDWKKHMQGIADQAKAANIRVAWCSPQACENPQDKLAIDTAGNRNLERFSEGVKQTAVANGNALFIDQFHPFLDWIDKARPTNPLTRVGGGDQVHPGPPGQTLMAAEILKGMKFPSLVSAAEIDATKLAVAQAQQCQITDLKAGADGGIQFKRLDAALPYFPDQAASILKWLPILEQLNDYRLKVTGLKPGRYAVRLGGTNVAEYADTELAQGVNLAAAALKAGPVAAQVKQVVAAVNAKNGYFHDRIFCGVLRAGIGIPDFVENSKAIVAQIESQRMPAFTKRMADMPPYDEAVRKALVIQAHTVEIVPVAAAAK